jgi:sucrose-6-phosphate hydrolase SacC (GH32 family)
VLPNPGIIDFRDPMVFWHDRSQHWVMALAVFDRIEFYSSEDLITWTYQSQFGQGIGSHGGVWECPDLFEVNGKWVLLVSNWGAPAGGSGSQYFIGDFDGKRFTLDDDFERLLTNEVSFPEGRVFEDFESGNYMDWTVTGNAFGSRPANGTFANQQYVSGYLGNGLVNTFLEGDQTTGSLTSAVFTLDFPYINFLIGGGNHPDGCTFNLVIDDVVVRSSTGRNNEALTWQYWDVGEYVGQEGSFSVIDNETGGWGHINLDHIYLSKTPILDEKVEAFWVDYGPDNYAGRSFENAPGNRVWLGWMSNWSYAGALPTQPWRGSMTLPREMTLQTFESGMRLVQHPIKELSKLEGGRFRFSNLSVQEGSDWLLSNGIKGKYLKIDMQLRNIQGVSGIKIRVGDGQETLIGYDPMSHEILANRSLSGLNVFEVNAEFRAPILEDTDVINFTIYVDDSAVEVFGNRGEAVISFKMFPENDAVGLEFFGDAIVSSFECIQMKSAWDVEVVDPILNVTTDPDHLFPNPTPDYVTLPDHLQGHLLELFDMKGKRYPVELEEKNRLKLPLPGGIYLLIDRTDHQTYKIYKSNP